MKYPVSKNFKFYKEHIDMLKDLRHTFEGQQRGKDNTAIVKLGIKELHKKYVCSGVKII